MYSHQRRYLSIAIVATILTPIGSALAQDLSDKEIENIVRRSWQYVAMYNVNNKFAMDPGNPMNTGGWNRVKANTTLADHTLKANAPPIGVFLAWTSSQAPVPAGSGLGVCSGT